MPKTRFSAVDLRAMVTCLKREVVGLRLANVYDIHSRKVYLLKFAKWDVKHHVLVESGKRLHITEWQRDKNDLPSAFTMKLRRHLRTKRLESVEQLGVDRVVDFTFGRADKAFHLIVEFYVSGNLLLTDHEYNIMLVLRRHTFENDTRIAVRERYPIASVVMMKPLNMTPGVTLTSSGIAAFTEELRTLERNIIQKRASAALTNSLDPTATTKKKTGKFDVNTVTYREVFSQLVQFAHPALLNHSLKSVDLRPNDAFVDSSVDALRRAALEAIRVLASVSAKSSKDLLDMQALLAAAGVDDIPTGIETGNHGLDDEEDDWLQRKDLREVAPHLVAASEAKKRESGLTAPGWIQYRPKAHDPPTATGTTGTAGTGTTTGTGSSTGGICVDIYEDFTPIMLSTQQKGEEGLQWRKFDSFHTCVDNYFSEVDLQRAAQEGVAKSVAAHSKIDKIRSDQQRRMDTLEAVQALADKHSYVIEVNVEFVEQVIQMMRSALATEIDWVDLELQIKAERRKNHPIASHIHSLNLKNGSVQLLLPERSYAAVPDDLDADCADAAMICVPVDLHLSARGNVDLLHSKRKQHQQKVTRTAAAADKAVQAAERNATKEMETSKHGMQKHTIQRLRKLFWFEKFYWFISSENYLVIAGRDATQNEILFRRYLQKNDIYVHADTHGSATCIIKNQDAAVPVPPKTLHEAGQMSICRSSAWEHKLITSAWWVYSQQVSKTAPTGEYLTTGAFMIRGKKNYLPPMKLEMTLAIMFQVSEDSVPRHAGERARKAPLVVEDATDAGTGKDDTGTGNESSADSAGDDNKSDDDEEHDVCTGGTGGNDKDEEDSAPVHDPGTGKADLTPTAKNEVCTGGTIAADKKADKALGASPDKKLRISRAERRKMKKGGDATAGTDTGTVEEKQVVKVAPRVEGGADTAKVDTAMYAAQVRRKKQKLKKFKEKYGEQDEEEREIALKLLGATKMKHELQDEATSNAAVVAVGDSPQAGTSPAGGDPTPDASHEPQPDTLTAAKNEMEKQKEAEEVRALLKAEDELFLQEDMKAKLSLLDCLTGVPVLQDSLVFAVPVCAPTAAVQNYTYKTKLQPGSMKKGKAVQQIIKLFSKQGSQPAQAELIRQVQLPELVACMVGPVKLSSPGMQNQRNKEKARKKLDARRMREASAAIDAELPL